MGIDDIINKAKDMLGTDQGEQISDTVLDKASDLAKNVSGGKFEGQVEGVRNSIDGAIGTEGK
ncbi:MT0933-like antitoxin protein [Arthrobacter alpinus]|uniref:MT0933-like antitoxin protein n=1 Tax=Arthrobacter alpinus TaxID=656366 RepID=A0A1H5LK83_9MICC|nr:antitoxin [Arthrobacter alpinus]SEE76831.1 MT0933-like antitoxin protein [Arthrobacter alpinus]